MKNNFNNYNKMYKKPETEEVVEGPALDVEVEKEPEKPKSVFGVVSDCVKLNVRVEPKADAEVLTVIDKGTKVKIYEDQSTEDFYKVSVKLAKNEFVYGYSMKKFITVE